MFSYSYDDAGRLLSIFHEVGAEVLPSFEYTYDPNGNRTQVQEYYQIPGAGPPKPGLPVYFFEGTTSPGRSGTTNANGEVTLRLPEGEYDFRVDFNGTQFWNDGYNHCPVPGCTLAGGIATIPAVVTV